MQGIIKLNILQFSLVYLLLLIVVAVMKKQKINQTKLLIFASFRMSVQLMLAGFVLTYIFQNPHPIFTVSYILLMIAFSIHRVISKNKGIGKRFKIVIALSLGLVGIVSVAFFIRVIIGTSIFNPQYAIPMGGMIIGNAMTGVSIGVKTFSESLRMQKIKIETLQNLGVAPEKILMPIVNESLETALLPTMNSMLGMGLVSLPGMMTGQILSGILPTTAILYQISIMITVCAVVCLSVFCSLYFGSKTLYNKDNIICII